MKSRNTICNGEDAATYFRYGTLLKKRCSSLFSGQRAFESQPTPNSNTPNKYCLISLYVFSLKAPGKTYLEALLINPQQCLPFRFSRAGQGAENLLSNIIPWLHISSLQHNPQRIHGFEYICLTIFETFSF